MGFIEEERLKVVIIGGGHGPSPFRRGLKERIKYLTSEVGNSDSGGSRGKMADDYGSSLAGDLTRAWADHSIDPFVTKLLSHRYVNGSLNPHRTGNVIFQAAVDVCRESNSLQPEIDALLSMKKLFPIVGDVFPTTLDRRDLEAVLADGTVIPKEHLIDERTEGSPIVSVRLSDKAIALHQATQAIEEADLVLLGPGSFWGSICAAILPEGMSESLRNTPAIVAYVANIANVKGQTDKWLLDDYIEKTEKLINRPVDAIIYFTRNINSMVSKLREAYLSYRRAGQDLVTLDGLKPEHRERLHTYDLVKLDEVFEDGEKKIVFRHDKDESANAAFDIVNKLGNRRKINQRLFVPV